MTEQQEKDYYADHTLSVSSVRLFAQNPARALADWNGEYPWFDGDGNALELGRAFHQMMEAMLMPILCVNKPTIRLKKAWAMS